MRVLLVLLILDLSLQLLELVLSLVEVLVLRAQELVECAVWDLLGLQLRRERALLEFLKIFHLRQHRLLRLPLMRALLQSLPQRPLLAPLVLVILNKAQLLRREQLPPI